MSGAVDLSALKERAQAQAQPPSSGAPSGDAPAGTVIQVTEANFETAVLQRSNEVPVVVALISGRSPASLDLADALAQLAETAGGKWVLGVVEVDSSMRIAQAFGVQAIPTVVAVAAGQPLADFQGPQPEPQLRQWIDAVLRATEGKLAGGEPEEADEPEPEDPRFTAAETALDEGDFGGAEAAYQAIIDAEPDNAEAKAALRQVRFMARAQDIPADAVATADADPANVDAALLAADAQVFAQQPEEAFARLIELVRKTAGDDRTRVRTRLLELFELFDPAEPFVVAARRKLAAALY
ncbi:tetratricopeptide repeat protein [Aldersonia sp. NBC_00410]|uniref:tetratricopeptide repeat protein n=1 Tax=Aldersonia sp. NBC_00410 TaxID=2975954 RepID=UPI0022594CFE|nr:tetratricopeptide repeat protein [Aldersonia sp. NBC_00410]MCX5042902.1 tetratricopeptide repeat protein [Aldersonia sp. NBC_00410]